MDDDFFPAAERALEAAETAGEQPASWTLTSALYIHLEEGRDWHEHGRAVEMSRESPRPLYGLPVAVEPGAWHSWTLRCASGALFDERGRVVYSTGKAS